MGLNVFYSFEFQSTFTHSPHPGARYNLFFRLGQGERFFQHPCLQPVWLWRWRRAGYFLDNQFSLPLDLGVDYLLESDIWVGSTRYNPGDNLGPPLNPNVHQ